MADSWELYLLSRVSGKERAKVEIWTGWVVTEDLLSGWTEGRKKHFIRIRVHNQEWWEVRWALSLVKIRGSKWYCRKFPWKVRFLVSSLCWMEISGWLGSSTHPMMKYCMLNTIASSWARWDLISSNIRNLVYKRIWILLFAIEPPSWIAISKVNIQMNEKGSVCKGWTIRETERVSFPLLLLHSPRQLC